MDANNRWHRGRPPSGWWQAEDRRWRPPLCRSRAATRTSGRRPRLITPRVGRCPPRHANRAPSGPPVALRALGAGTHRHCCGCRRGDRCRQQLISTICPALRESRGRSTRRASRAVAYVVGRDVGDGASPMTLSDYIGTQFDPALSWADVEWLRSVWSGPVVLKGVQTVDDAVLAADAGVDARGAVQPRRSPARRGPGDVRPGGARGRRGRREGRDHLRRRGATRERHRQGGRRRRRRLHGRSGLPVRPGERRASGASTRCSTGSTPTWCAR